MKAKVNKLGESVALLNRKAAKRSMMKVFAMSVLFLASCSERTPVSHIYDIPEYSVHEIAERVLDYNPVVKGNIELYYKENGNWYPYGAYPLVSIYLDYDDEWRDIVVFDNSYIIHFVEDESRGNFHHYVMYDGKKLYF